LTVPLNILDLEFHARPLLLFLRRGGSFGILFGFANYDVIALRAGNCTMNQQQILSFADLNDFQVLNRALDLAHVTGHPHSTHDRAGEQTLTDGTSTTTPALRSVRGITTAKIMA